jgi:sphingomyelin phosphodiesterase
MRTREFKLHASSEAMCTKMTGTRYRWRSDVSAFPGLDGQTRFGPTFVHEYSTRAAYGSNITWGKDDPLNATWWHLVTERASPTAPPVSSLIPF